MPTADYSSYHQPQGSTSDGTKFDNFIDAVQTNMNGIDHNNLAASAGILASQLADPTAGKVLGSAGSACAAVFPPGYEIAQATNAISGALGTALTDVVSAGAATYDGAVVWVIATCPQIQFTTGSVPGDLASFGFDIDGTDQGIEAALVCPYSVATVGLAFYAPLFVAARLTPAAGARTIKLRGKKSNAGATVNFLPGTGGAGVARPAAIRVIKV